MDHVSVHEEKSANSADSSFLFLEFPEPSSDEFIKDEEEEEEKEEDEEEEEKVLDGLFPPPPHHTGDSRGQYCEEEETEGKHADNGETAGGRFEEETLEGGPEEESDVCSSAVWEQLEEVVCEVIEEEEGEMVQRAAEGNVEERDEEGVDDPEGTTQQEEEEGGGGRGATEAELRGGVKTGGASRGSGGHQSVGPVEMNVEKEKIEEETTSHHGEDAGKNKNNGGADEPLKLPQVEYRKEAEFDGLIPQSVARDTLSGRGVGRTLVISKNPKIYQVKAVPVVPPKPKHCRFTALSLRQQQQQQQQHRDGASREALLEQVWAAEEQEKDGGEKECRRRSDRWEEVTRRNSPLSMCFDEAVAMATIRREKERECEKEKWDGK